MQSLDGRIRRITRLNGPLISIDDAAWKERFENMVPRRASADQRAMLARYMGTKPFDTYPAFSRVRVDPANRTWIQDYETLGSWTVLDSNGFLLGRFDVPGAGLESRAQIAGLAANFVVLLQVDADGAVRLDFHRHL